MVPGFQALKLFSANVPSALTLLMNATSSLKLGGIIFLTLRQGIGDSVPLSGSVFNSAAGFRSGTTMAVDRQSACRPFFRSSAVLDWPDRHIDGGPCLFNPHGVVGLSDCGALISRESASRTPSRVMFQRPS